MLKKLSLLLILISGMSSSLLAENNFYQFSAKLLNGELVNMSDYKDKVILVANTASNCGFTPQYEGLQEIYLKYKDRGLVVLAFPSNDFGAQEPGSNEEIGLFCQNTYDVTFPVFEKSVVLGPEKTALFKFLTESSREDLSGEIKWNFEKFLISKEGRPVARFRSAVIPTSNSITEQIEELLKSPAGDIRAN